MAGGIQTGGDRLKCRRIFNAAGQDCMSEALLSIGLLIVVAKLIEGVLNRFGVSSIVAFTAAGILLGPVFGLVNPEGHILIFLEIGVFIFFFLIGLDEIDIPGFMATIGGRYFLAATVSMVISIAASLVVTADLLNLGFALGEGGHVLKFTAALSLAGILSLSSLGLVNFAASSVSPRAR